MGHHHHCNSSCSNDSCSSGSSSSGSCCSENQSSKCSCCGSCQCHGCQGKGKYADELLHLADEAWMELLKEKIKEEIRLNGGEQITNLARIVSTANHTRWKEKMQCKKDHEDFETQLKNAMCGCSQKK